MNNKYYEPWNERTTKFQRKDDYAHVPFSEHEKLSAGNIAERIVWWGVAAVGVWLWICI